MAVTFALFPSMFIIFNFHLVMFKTSTVIFYTKKVWFYIGAKLLEFGACFYQTALLLNVVCEMSYFQQQNKK